MISQASFRLLPALLVAVFTLTSALHAQDSESKLGTPVTSLPFNITAPGVYSVNTELPTTTMQSGAAITISADNVTLELNGHNISNTNASNAAEGIYAYDHKNVTVHNGAVRGFWIGVDFPSSVTDGSKSSAHKVEGIAVDGSTWFGIRVYGSGNVVRRCQVTNSGGSTAGDNNGYGIIVQTGSGNLVTDNEVTGVKAANSSHASYGICLLGGTGAFVLNNRVAQTGTGIYYDGGTSGKYRDNLASDSVTTPFVGGTNAGGNGMSGDENGDGVGDSWEKTYFNTLNVDVNALASNGSGLTNLQMYVLNLSPLVEQHSSSLTPVTGLKLALSGTQATLSWTNAGSGIQYYGIQYSVDGGTTWLGQTAILGNLSSVAMSGLTLGANYTFRMASVNQSGFSSPSASDTAPLITLTTPSGAVLVP